MLKDSKGRGWGWNGAYPTAGLVEVITFGGRVLSAAAQVLGCVLCLREDGRHPRVLVEEERTSKSAKKE